MAKNRRRNQTRTELSRRQVKRIDVLPDDVLLGIFDFHVDAYSSFICRAEMEAWQSLVHVCRRWRSLVFRSPCRLDLRLVCTPKRPVKGTLDVWPALPLIVRGILASSGTVNVITALQEQSNRVCQVDLLVLTNWELEKVLAAMQVPFPELIKLRLSSLAETVPVISDSFLDGSSPRLRHFSLSGVLFPGLPNLLSTATHLVDLKLSNIPDSGYISPEAMVALLSALSSLETLCLDFKYPQSRPGRESQSLLQLPLKRSILPALHELRFRGITKYLEELVSRIDTPQLHHVHIDFFGQIDFDCPRLAQFINCTPTLRVYGKAYVKFDDWRSSIALLAQSRTLGIAISCRKPEVQLLSVARVCNSFLPPPSAVKDLYIKHEYSRLVWKNGAIENTQWLQLLLPFAAVKNLYLSKEFVPSIAPTLQELIEGRITEVLPSLRNIFVEELEPSGPLRENIGQFVAARQLSGHPVAISVWNDPVQNEGEGEEESALSCMHSTLTSIRRQANIVVCAQRKHCGRNWQGSLVSE